MKAITKVLASGGFIAALAIATPAAAQYNPYGYGSGNILGQVIQSVIGGGYGSGYGGYQVNSQVLVNQCANAVQARLNGGGAYGGYGYANPYGYAGGARVLGISRVEQRSNGGLTVRGVASSGANAYAYGGYGAQQQIDLTWKCRTDYRGMIADIDIDRAQSNYGYNQNYNYQQNYTPYNQDYSQYGYRRY